MLNFVLDSNTHCFKRTLVLFKSREVLLFLKSKCLR